MTTPAYSKTALRRQPRRPAPLDPQRAQTSGVEESMLFGESAAGGDAEPERKAPDASAEVPAKHPE